VLFNVKDVASLCIAINDSCMFEQQPQNLQLRIQQLTQEALQKAEPSAWFDVLYAEAQGDVTKVPWAKLAPHPYLQEWLAHHQPFALGQKALIIGCGLGDDAEALAKLGFDVTAFDISLTAISGVSATVS